MNQNKWKKIVGIFLILGVLVLSFWYGGNAPGLQGFSVDNEVNESAYNVSDGSGDKSDYKVSDRSGGSTSDNLESSAKKEDNRKKSSDSKELSDSNKDKKPGLLRGIVMKIKKLGSSGSKKNLQVNKRAQKNANKAVKKSNKAKKKKSAVADNNTGSNNTGKNNQSNRSEDSRVNNNENNNNTVDNKSIDDENDNNAVDNKNVDDDKSKKASDDSKKGTSDNQAADDSKSQAVSGDTETQKSDDSDKQTTESDDSDNVEKITCTIYISCASVLDHMDKLSDATKKVIPEDGVILNLTTVNIKRGSTVFDVLQKAARDNKVHLEYNYTPAYKTYYIEGIGNLYQFDAGNLSGWMYSVNGKFPGVGCSGYKVNDGDSINWIYTCSFGKDVGGYTSE